MHIKPELKPCPFCGSTNIAIEYYKDPKENEFPYWQICCDRCGVMTSKCEVEYEYVNEAYEAYISTIEDVINLWNKRVGE